MNNLNNDIKNTIIEMSKDFDDHEGFITCEISIHKDMINEFELFIKDNIKIKFGRWIVFKCEACESYRGNGYVHASIEKYDVVDEIEKCSNHIKTI